MEINVVDVSDRALLRTEWRLQQLGKTVLESNLSVSNAVAQMVKDVIAAAGGPGSVSVLRIYSHGNQGVFNIAGEIGYDSNGKKENYSTEKDGNAIAVSNIFTGLVVEASPSGGLTSSPATPIAAENTRH